jgi:hypothetical protein
MTPLDAEKQLKTFIDKFDAPNQKLIRGVRKAMQKRFPTAIEMVYDNYNFFVIGYSPTEKASHAICSIAAGANGVSVCFLYGAKLPDPRKVLSGSGNQTRFLRVESPATLARPEIEALFKAAVANSCAPFDKQAPGRLIIKSISAKQRPRKKER